LHSEIVKLAALYGAAVWMGWPALNHEVERLIQIGEDCGGEGSVRLNTKVVQSLGFWSNVFPAALEHDDGEVEMKGASCPRARKSGMT